MTSHDTAKNLMRKHVMSPTKFTMTQTTNDHFNISDVSQHVKRWITNNDSNGVTNPKFIILTTRLTTGLTAHVRRCVWCKPCKLRRKFTDIWPNLPFTRLAHWILTDCEPSHTTLRQQIRWRMMAKTKGGRRHCCTYSAARGHSVTGQTSREALATHVTTGKAS